MAATEVPELRAETRRIPWASVIGALTAAVLFLVAAALQLTASLQRWVVFRGSLTGDELSAEDHLYDYSYPYDPWEPIGTAAELYGFGLLLTAVGVLVLPLGVAAMRRPRRRHAVVAAIEILLAVLVACALGVDGAHALLSGLTGTPSPLQHSGAVTWIAFVGLIALGVMWRTSVAAMATCLFLLGSTGVGYLFATFVIAPLFAGGISHDTTPGTETVIAATTAAAGIAMLIGAWVVVRRNSAQTCPPK